MPTVLILVTENTAPLTTMVAQLGYEIIGVAELQTLMQELADRRPEVTILSEVAIDTKAEKDLLTEIREATSGNVVVAGTSEGDRVSQLLLRGADAYLKLPVGQKALSGRLHALLRLR